MIGSGSRISEDSNVLRLCKQRTAKVYVQLTARNQQMDVVAIDTLTDRRQQLLKGNARVRSYVSDQQIPCGSRYRRSVVPEVVL
jgi:hypothetical protein